MKQTTFPWNSVEQGNLVLITKTGDSDRPHRDEWKIIEDLFKMQIIIAPVASTNFNKHVNVKYGATEQLAPIASTNFNRHVTNC